LPLLSALARRGTFAEPGLEGYLEAPRPGQIVAGGPLRIRGWLTAEDRAIVGLTVQIDPEPERAVDFGMERPDLAKSTPASCSRARAGFAVDLPRPETPGRTRLTLWVRLDDGRRLRAFRCTVRVPPPPPTRHRRRGRSLAELGGRAVAVAGSWLDELRSRWRDRDLRAAYGSLLEEIRPQVGDWRPHRARLYRALRDEYRASGAGTKGLERDLSAALELPPALPRVPATRPSRRHRRRILYVSGMFPSVTHGGGLRLYDILSSLGSRHEVDLYSVYRADLDRPSLDRLLPRLGAVRLVRSDDMRPTDVTAWLKRRGVQPGAYDVIHFEYPRTFSLIPTLRPYGEKIFFTLVECVTRRTALDLELGLSQDHARLGRAGRELLEALRLERLACRTADQGIAVTADDAAYAERICGGSPLAIIPTCVSEEEVIARVAPDDLALLEPHTASFVGYFDHYPNLDAVTWYLERVHPTVLARVPDYRLHVIGRGDLSGVARRFAGPSVRIVGAVDDLMRELARGQVAVAPIISGAGIRGKINQYSAAGRPVVATQLGASGLAYRDGESILIADEPDRFADAVVRLLTDPALWQRLRAGSQRVLHEHYRWPAALRRLEELYVA
jgi:glycosyltransferase involved in cell wall biosynthesis